MSLILTQKQGNTIFIGTEEEPRLISITTMCATNQVRLAIDAPDSLTILREEVLIRNELSQKGDK